MTGFSVRPLWEDALNLLYPLQCAGCGKWDTDLCPDCWMIAHGDPQLAALDGPDALPEVPLWYLGPYAGALRRIVLAAKHEPNRNLDAFLFQAGARLADSVVMNLAGLTSPVWVVPAPSSWRRRWDRQEVTGTIARGMAAGLRAHLERTPVLVVGALRLLAGSGSQSKKGKEARRQGRKGRLLVARRPAPGTAVVVVDDVAATGATLAEIGACLGENVQAAAVLARA